MPEPGRGPTFRESWAALQRIRSRPEGVSPWANNGGLNRRDEDTAIVHERINEGATLTELAAERGITPQALGRRLRKYRARHGLTGRVPTRGRRARA